MISNSWLFGRDLHFAGQFFYDLLFMAGLFLDRWFSCLGPFLLKLFRVQLFLLLLWFLSYLYRCSQSFLFRISQSLWFILFWESNLLNLLAARSLFQLLLWFTSTEAPKTFTALFELFLWPLFLLCLIFLKFGVIITLLILTWIWKLSVWFFILLWIIVTYIL